MYVLGLNTFFSVTGTPDKVDYFSFTFCAHVHEECPERKKDL